MNLRTSIAITLALAAAVACLTTGSACDDAESTFIQGGQVLAETGRLTPTNAAPVRARRSWHLIGNPLTPGHDTYEATVVAPEGTRRVHMWIDRIWAASATSSNTEFSFRVRIRNLAVGKHEILFSADNVQQAFAQHTMVRTHPLYVLVGAGWEEPDVPDTALQRQEDLHRLHPHLALTHFVGPASFTDPSVSPARRNFLASWLRNLRDTEGDEIALQLHPYCSFVEFATVPCKTSPSYASEQDATGRTVYLGAYSESDTRSLLSAADSLFIDLGLGKPQSFRAGAWTAELHTLHALAGYGYLADSSAVHWRQLEEWNRVRGATLYNWLSDHWASITHTSQPYYPSQNDVTSSTSPTINLLEVPSNGTTVDYASAAEMIDMFEANSRSVALPEPLAYSIGYNPSSFSYTHFRRIDDTLDHIDRRLAATDGGPVVYARMSDIKRVWRR
jgi:hypothetical protein